MNSIQKQLYENIEIIVVDRDSSDATKDIAGKYTTHVYNHGPERSAQRNYGAKMASGKYVAIIDSDMELAEGVIGESVSVIESSPGVKGVVIPEESFGEGFWAQCKKLERSFYVGVDWMEAARFFAREDYLKVGGYNESMVSGEDWDLSNRIKKLGSLGRVQSYIFHNEGKISLLKTLKKKAYYAGRINQYVDANQDSTSTGSEVGKVFKRFGLYFSRPTRLFRNPLVGLGMLFMKVGEFGAGLFGLLKLIRAGG